MALLSMDKNGDNVQLIHNPEVVSSGRMGGYYEAIPGGYLFGGEFLRPDGNYDQLVFVYTLEAGRQALLQKTADEQLADYRTICAQHALDLNGDFSVISSFFARDMNYEDTLCWFQNGEPVFTDISEIPAWGGYLQDNIIRCFYPGDGYYDVDLLTGERMKLADAQLEDSKAQILQPNCIIETTLLNPEAAAETQEMRFFDGQQWHTVTLPEELEVPDETFEVVAVTSDTVIFSVKRTEKMPLTYAKVTIYTFYQMKLGGETYTVEPMGTFQKPMGTSLADQP